MRCDAHQILAPLPGTAGVILKKKKKKKEIKNQKNLVVHFKIKKKYIYIFLHLHLHLGIRDFTKKRKNILIVYCDICN